MTNKEAIASLKTLCHTCELFPKCVNDKPECFQAIELAISALQEQDSPKPTAESVQNVQNEDLISRKAAIDVAENAFVRGLLASPDIRRLPSVQPESCEDAVSRDSVKFLLCKETCHPGAFCPDGFCREICEKVDALPSATPKQRMGEWIPVSERLPEELETVIITWKNHKPESYYSDIKDKPLTGVGIYHREKWWWWSAYAEDMLVEYGDSKADRMDEAIEVTAWMPLPEPYRAERRTNE